MPENEFDIKLPVHMHSCSTCNASKKGISVASMVPVVIDLELA